MGKNFILIFNVCFILSLSLFFIFSASVFANPKDISNTYLLFAAVNKDEILKPLDILSNAEKNEQNLPLLESKEPADISSEPVLGKKGEDTQLSTENNMDTGIMPPDQNTYKDVVNRYYKSGGNNGQNVFIYYPEFGIPSVDKVFKDFAESIGKSFEDFNKDIPSQGEEDSSSSSQIELTGFYTLEKPNPDVISVVFNIYDYTGGAHGQLRIVVFNYDLKTAQQLTFSEIFGKPQKALQILSDLSSEKLRELLGEDVDEEMLKEGTEPQEENFSCIVLLPDGITIEFQPYQVGPWSIGQPHITFSLEELKEALPNPKIWPILKPISD